MVNREAGDNQEKRVDIQLPQNDEEKRDLEEILSAFDSEDKFTTSTKTCKTRFLSKISKLTSTIKLTAGIIASKLFKNTEKTIEKIYYLEKIDDEHDNILGADNESLLI